MIFKKEGETRDTYAKLCPNSEKANNGYKKDEWAICGKNSTKNNEKSYFFEGVKGFWKSFIKKRGWIFPYKKSKK